MKRFLSKKVMVVMFTSFLLTALFHLAAYIKDTSDYKRAVKEITFDGIQIPEVSDGVYIGECDVDFIYAKVEVVVRNGKITAITILEHKQERGKSAEPVIDDIIEEQKVDVDAISGVTNSSIVLKKAVEAALKKGL